MDLFNKNLEKFSDICAFLELKEITKANSVDINFSAMDEHARFKKSLKESKLAAGAELEIGIKISPGTGVFYALVSKQLPSDERRWMLVKWSKLDDGIFSVYSMAVS